MSVSPISENAVDVSYFHYSHHPNPDFEFEYDFIYRFLLATTYFFLPISNGSSITFSNTFKSTVVREMDPPVLMNGANTIYHKLPYFSSNPALRTKHISKEWCQSAVIFKIGFRIMQTFTEAGLPIQIKCSTCHPTIHGLPTFFYNYPERDFTEEFGSLRLSSRIISNSLDYCSEVADCKQKLRVSPFLDLYIKSGEDLIGHNIIGFSQYISRWSGEQTPNEIDRIIQGIPDGELYITAPWHRSSEVNENKNSWKIFGMEGLTSMCAMELDDRILGSNIFINTDAIGRQTVENETRKLEVFTYNDYENIDLKVKNFKIDDMNLEIFVFWSSWSCCSACCCTSAICGYELQTAGDCDVIFSSKTRRGLLSVRKVDVKTKINLPEDTGELENLLSLPPYTNEGVPIFSTLLLSKSLNYVFSAIQEKLIIPFLETNQETNYNFSSGVFVESISCKADPQKLDCNKWAQCQGIDLGDINNDIDKEESDSCHQIALVDVLVGKKSIKVQTHLKENLRIRMDPEVHDLNSTNAQWRVNMRKPKKYDKTRHCSIQGVILKNNEILVIGLETFDLKIDLLLNKKEKVRIGFMDESTRRKRNDVYWTVFYWILAISAFFIFLISFVVFMHREKKNLVQKTLKNREGKIL